MGPEKIALIAGLMIFAASLLSLRLGVSAAIFEILLGLAAGAAGLKAESWMVQIAGFGGIVLTFLAGAEVDTKLLKDNFRRAGLISLASFAAPLAGGYLFCRYAAGWNAQASLIAGVALSETSLAVVYSALVETGRSASATGRLLMTCTFLTNSLTALALSLLFLEPNLYTVLFLAVSALFLINSGRFNMWLIRHPALSGKVTEPEIKYIFFILLAFVYLAGLGSGQAILPAFVFGLLMGRHFKAQRATAGIKSRLRTVAYAFITPFFFIVAGMKVSPEGLLAAPFLFTGLFAVKQLGKFLGVHFLMARWFPKAGAYSTLLMSTGLTFGLIAVLSGVRAGWLDPGQYSVLTGVLIASAVLPTFAAQRWFPPAEDEDLK